MAEKERYAITVEVPGTESLPAVLRLRLMLKNAWRQGQIKCVGLEKVCDRDAIDGKPAGQGRNPTSPTAAKSYATAPAVPGFPHEPAACQVPIDVEPAEW